MKIAGTFEIRRLLLFVTASILAVIPCLSPCFILGIPFGIWALVVINQADVKEAFHS